MKGGAADRGESSARQGMHRIEYLVDAEASQNLAVHLDPHDFVHGMSGLCAGHPTMLRCQHSKKRLLDNSAREVGIDSHRNFLAGS